LEGHAQRQRQLLWIWQGGGLGNTRLLDGGGGGERGRERGLEREGRGQRNRAGGGGREGGGHLIMDNKALDT